MVIGQDPREYGVLSKVIVSTASDGIKVAQVLKIRDLSLHPGTCQPVTLTKPEILQYLTRPLSKIRFQVLEVQPPNGTIQRGGCLIRLHVDEKTGAIKEEKLQGHELLLIVAEENPLQLL